MRIRVIRMRIRVIRMRIRVIRMRIRVISPSIREGLDSEKGGAQRGSREDSLGGVRCVSCYLEKMFGSLVGLVGLFIV